MKTTLDTDLLDVALAAAARTNIRFRREAIATVERVDGDDQGAAYVLAGADGSWVVVLDNWRATPKTRLSGTVSGRHPGHGRVIGLPCRGRLDYATTPRDHADWRNVPDGAWTAAVALYARLEANR